MPRKVVGGRAVTEQMGAASAAMMEMNDQWIQYLRWRKGEAENRLRATGDLDDALTDLGGTPAPPPRGPDTDGAAGGLSPWATGLAGPADGSGDLAAWEGPGGEEPPIPGGEERAGLWADWTTAGELEPSEAEGVR